MFGYITINKPELKIREFDTYQSYYCGLCKKINEKYGIKGRIGLSYDMTFLQILLTGLYEPKKVDVKQGCILHPFERKTVLQNEITEYVADMNVLLMYHKCEDDWLDEKKISRGTIKKLLEKSRKEIKRNHRDKVNEIEDALYEIDIKEIRGCTDIDEMSGLSGKMLGNVFTYKNDEWTEELYKVGFYLGKFIYLCDAYEDIEEDIEKNRYNPLLDVYNKDNFEEYCKDIMNITMAECCKAFEILPIIENVDILRNILYSGVWNRYEKTRKKRELQKG